MMWTALNTLPSLEGKPRDIRVLFADTANAAMSAGRTKDEAIFTALAVVKQKERATIKKYVKPSNPLHLQAILDLKNTPRPSQEELQQLEKQNQPKDSLDVGKEVVGANFDADGRLILKFKDGKTITSNVAPITAVQNSVVVVDNANTKLTGGNANQVLVKVSDTEDDYEWQDMVVNIPEYTRLIDQVDANTMYIGESVPSTEVCDAFWRIKKVTQTGDDMAVVWSNGSAAFDKVWDARLTYTYTTECTP